MGMLTCANQVLTITSSSFEASPTVSPTQPPTLSMGRWTLRLEASKYCNMNRCNVNKPQGVATIPIHGFDSGESFAVIRIDPNDPRNTKGFDCSTFPGSSVLMLVASGNEKVDARTGDQMLTCGNQDITILPSSFF